MHLLNAEKFQLEHFLGKSIPTYAILSHTWGPNEILFKQLSASQDGLHTEDSFSKIRDCCRQARKDGLNYVWIDTCCINSESSAELSEAINSMYEWYSAASVCYALLSDVVSGISLRNSVLGLL